MDAALSVEEVEGSEGELTAKTDLAAIDIYTQVGDHYRFPAMSKSALEVVLPKGSNRKSDQPLTLVNASTTILMIPLRICAKILVDGEEWWVSPV
jgi:hypothetical protein